MGRQTLGSAKLATVIPMACLAWLGTQAMAGTLILEYKFNETGTTAASSGSDTTSVTMRDRNGTITDLHSAAGLGVSGAATDRAFDNTGSTAMGNYGQGGSARTAATLSSLTGLKSFTVSGWIKADAGETLSGTGEKILDFYNNAATSGFRVVSSGGFIGQLNVEVNGIPAWSSSANYNSSGWMFFAVSYDSTTPTNNVKYYVGSTSGAVVSTATGTRSLDAGAVGATDLGMSLGGASTGWNGRSFDGYMDNIRVYGSKDDASGVLSQSDLEAIRTGDIAPVPEASSMALVVISGSVLIAARGWRRK